MKKHFFAGIMLVLGASILNAGDTNTTATPFTGKIQKLAVKKALLDPAYDMPIDLKSKLLCEATLKNGKTAYFISPKSMMMVYLHQDYFKKHKLLEEISRHSTFTTISLERSLKPPRLSMSLGAVSSDHTATI